MDSYLIKIFILSAIAATCQGLQNRASGESLSSTSPASSSSSNSTEKVDLVTFVTSTAQAVTPSDSNSSQNQKLLQEKCNKNPSSNRRCQKLREKEKQKFGSINDIWNDADMSQHPIDEEPRRMDRALGEMCLYSSDCVSGCCMLDRETKIRSCQPKAIQGDKCTTAQIKADLYVDVCPCESGDSFCVYPGEYCSK